MTLLELLEARRSTPARLLEAPGPDAEALREITRACTRVPDHGRLAPWRLLHVCGEARHALGEIVAARGRELEPDAGEAADEKNRQRFSHAPSVVVVIGCIQPGHRIPEVEQLLSGGCVCFSLLQAAQAMGFGGQWITGWPAYDAVVKKALGLTSGESILGFIHLGTPSQEVPERNRPDPDDLLSTWSPA